MAVQSTPSRLLERDAELDRIGRALHAAREGRGQLIVVEGEAGIGKSALVDAAVDHARRQEMSVLRAAGTELEQDHPFAVAAALLRPLASAPEGRWVLEGAGAPAAAVFDRSARGGTGAQPDPVSVLHAMGWLVIDAAERGPMAILVDDAHWADEPSLRFVAYLGHRIGDLPIALVVATRPAASIAPEVFEQVRAHRSAVRLTLEPLGRQAVRELIEQAGGQRLADAQREAIWQQAGGNPFYVQELVRAAPPRGAAASASVPDTIRASIRRRVRSAGRSATPLVEWMAILGDAAHLPLAAAMATVEETNAASAFRDLVERGVLAPDGRTFSHPIVRTAILEEIPGAVRDEMNRRAARTLVESDPSGAAAHLMVVPPASLPWCVDILREGARVAVAQGDPRTAARFLDRALREPAPDAVLGALLLELGNAEAAAAIPFAPSRYDEAVRHLTDAHERAQARLSQGHAYIQSGRWAEGATAFRAGLDEDVRDAELKSRLEAGFIASAHVGLSNREEATLRLQRILGAPFDDPAHRELAAWTAFQQSMGAAAPAHEVAALARRAVDGAPLESLVVASQVIELVAGVLISTGDVEEELDLLGRAIEVAQAQHAYQKVGIYSYCRALAQLASGRLRDALADAAVALATHEHGWEVFYPGTMAAIAWARLETGDLDDADAALQMDDERWMQRLDYQFMVRIARGRVHASRGDHLGALRHFDQAREAGVSLGVCSPSVLSDWRTWAAISLRAVGRRDEAIEVAEEALEIATRWGAPIALAPAERAIGTVRGGAEGLIHLRRAAEMLEGTPLRLEHVRAVGSLGAALRRAGHDVEARQVLRRAAELARAIGATGLETAALDELRAAGGRLRRAAVHGVPSLTPSELRVVRLAVEGRTNREIAQALFVTPKAIEYHLANAYRKLSIGSRTELAVALEAGEAEARVSV